VVSEQGVETDPEKIAALKTWPVPQHLKELKAFLGFCGYYRKFIKGYSNIMKPLNDLTSGYPPLKKHPKPKEAYTSLCVAPTEQHFFHSSICF